MKIGYKIKSYPPFSVAGKQLGKDDERDLFPEAIRLIEEIRPRAVMLENVRGFLDPGFDEYREHIFSEIKKLGYVTHIKLLNASNFGVPQLRPRVVIVGIRKDQIGAFAYPEEKPDSAPTVGKVLYDLMAENGWEKAKEWAAHAGRIAPTLVGGAEDFKTGNLNLGNNIGMIYPAICQIGTFVISFFIRTGKPSSFRRQPCIQIRFQPATYNLVSG